MANVAPVVPTRVEDYDSDDDLLPDDTVTGGMFVPALMAYGEFGTPRDPMDMPANPSELLYLEILLDSYWELVLVLDKEEEDAGLRAEGQYPAFVTHVMMILCSSSKELLVSIIDGTLPRRAVDDSRPYAKRFLALNEEERAIAVDEIDGKQVVHQPVIFGQYLVNDEGFGPTEKELSSLIILVRLYTNPGHPVFEEYVKLVNANSSRDCSRLPREAVDYFCDRVSARLQSPPSDARPRALANFAYSPTPQPSRQNRLLCLVETVCKLYFPQYKIHHHVVYRIYTPEQAWFGEMAFNRLGQACTETGFGFNYKPPGRATFRAADIAARHYIQWAYNAMWSTEVQDTFSEQQAVFNGSEWKREMSEAYSFEYDIQLNHIEKLTRDMRAGNAGDWRRLMQDTNVEALGR